MVHSGIAAAASTATKHSEFGTRTLADFKAYKIRALVATDIASRGLDIVDLPHVINYECLIFPMIIFTALGAPVAPALRGKQSLWLAPAKSGFCRELKPSSVKRWFVKLRRALSRLTNVPLTKLKENSKKTDNKTAGGTKVGRRLKRGKEKSRSGYKPRRDSTCSLPRDAKGFRGKPRRDSNVQPRDAKVLQGKPRRDSGYKPKVLKGILGTKLFVSACKFLL